MANANQTGRISQVNGQCMAAAGKALDLTFLRMTHEMIEQDAMKDDKGQPQKSDDDELDSE